MSTDQSSQLETVLDDEVRPCAPFPLLSITTPASLAAAKSFRDNNLPTIFIASYPKSGTTWMQCIIYNLLTKGTRTDFEHISQYTPFFDSHNTFDLSSGDIKASFQSSHQNLGYHVFNTHFSYDMLPHSDNTKFIYVIRKGRDVCVSFYHHLSNQDDADLYQGTFSQFLVEFLSGKLPYGSRTHHLKLWWEADRETSQAATSPILFVHYEDLISNLRQELQRIISFLDLRYSDEELDEVLPLVSFEYMKAHKNQFEPISVPWKPGFEFIRRGQVGDHKMTFTEVDEDFYARHIRGILDELRPASMVQREELEQWFS